LDTLTNSFGVFLFLPLATSQVWMAREPCDHGCRETQEQLAESLQGFVSQKSTPAVNEFVFFFFFTNGQRVFLVWGVGINPVASTQLCPHRTKAVKQHIKE
jgi:hypothetical protein